MLSANLTNKFQATKQYKDIDGMLFSAASPGGSPGESIDEAPVACSPVALGFASPKVSVGHDA